MLYKQKPARVTGVSGDKLEIETPGGAVRVRPKDVLALHPGPVGPLGALRVPDLDPQDVWSLVEGETLPLADLADLAFGAFTPEAALAVWRWVQDGTYFGGTPDAVSPRPAGAVEAARAAQDAKNREADAQAAFLAALRAGEVTDRRRLADVEGLALGRAAKSPTLAALGRPETPAEAHALLLRLGVWDDARVPHAERGGVDTRPVALPFPPLPDEARLDLTHLPALAIDDEGSADPDDAIGLEHTPDGWRLWVHVADVAALVTPDGDLDREARRRGATLYLPDRTIPMLPEAMTDLLGLGLAEESPALSLALDLDDAFEPRGAEVHLTRVRVTRLTYAQAWARIDEPLLADLARFARAARARREAAGAVLLDLPEARVRVRDGNVTVQRLPGLESRLLVQEAMMLAGWGAATWASARDLPLPFAAQDAPLSRVDGDDLPASWARRKTLARTRFAPAPGPHAGLGLDPYAQATSPMRRYLDLVVHQQLRAALLDEPALSGRDIAARVAEADLAAGAVRAAERASNRHWTLVFLRRSGGWRGEGVVVERRGALATVLLPDLAFDTALSIPNEVGETVTVEFVEADLGALSARFRVVE